MIFLDSEEAFLRELDLEGERHRLGISARQCAQIRAEVMDRSRTDGGISVCQMCGGVEAEHINVPLAYRRPPDGKIRTGHFLAVCLVCFISAKVYQALLEDGVSRSQAHDAIMNSIKAPKMPAMFERGAELLRQRANRTLDQRQSQAEVN